MNARKPPVLAAALVLLAGAFGASAASAAVDVKSISPSTCQPRGPGTLASELSYSPYGLTNPGTANVTVICPINGDTESNWGTTETVDSSYVSVYYRAGAVAGFVGCTVFTGTAVVSASPTYSKSYTPAPSPANGRGNFRLSLVEASGTYGVAPASVLICTISPKATLGWIYLRETLATDTP